MKIPATVILTIFYIGSLVGAFVHNFWLTLVCAGVLIAGYVIETVPTEEDPEADGFLPPEDDK